MSVLFHTVTPKSLLFAVSATAFALGIARAEAGGFDYRYTDFTAKTCTTKVDEPEEGPGSAVKTCKGPGGVVTQVIDYDDRVYVSFNPSKDEVADSYGPGFRSFNSIGKKMEWVMKGKRPVATILRYYLQTDSFAKTEYDDGTGSSKTQVLKVTKLPVGGRPGCSMAFIDARGNKNANALARSEARKADAFICGKDKPYAVGKMHFHFGLEAEEIGLDLSRTDPRG